MDFKRLSSKYFGAVASDYDTHRLDDKWVAEQQAVEELLREVPQGSSVLDAPTGTGRLIPLLTDRELAVTGVDVSADMIREARRRADRHDARVDLRQADIRHLPFAAGSFDLVICLRFMNWVDKDGVRTVMNELCRVAESRLLIGVRYLTPPGELGLKGADFLRRGASLLRLPSLRTRRWGILIHTKPSIERLFRSLDLIIVQTRMIERRWDATDYVFYWLAKKGSAGAGDHRQTSR